jgi:hypothetical protein
MAQLGSARKAVPDARNVRFGLSVTLDMVIRIRLDIVRAEYRLLDLKLIVDAIQARRIRITDHAARRRPQTGFRLSRSGREVSQRLCLGTSSSLQNRVRHG